LYFYQIQMRYQMTKGMKIGIFILLISLFVIPVIPATTVVVGGFIKLYFFNIIMSIIVTALDLVGLILIGMGLHKGGNNNAESK
jgi:hypothetical protein